MAKVYRSSIEVRGYELDSFGHVNHAVYLNFFEHARWKMLEEEGITLPLLQKIGRFPIIVAVEVQYMKPTYKGDLLSVETEVVEHTRTKMIMAQTLSRAGVPVCRAKIVSVIVNSEGRPVEIPKEFEKAWS